LTKKKFFTISFLETKEYNSRCRPNDADKPRGFRSKASVSSPFLTDPSSSRSPRRFSNRKRPARRPREASAPFFLSLTLRSRIVKFDLNSAWENESSFDFSNNGALGAVLSPNPVGLAASRDDDDDYDDDDDWEDDEEEDEDEDWDDEDEDWDDEDDEWLDEDDDDDGWIDDDDDEDDDYWQEVDEDDEDSDDWNDQDYDDEDDDY
jgi:hypothetical protein